MADIVGIASLIAGGACLIFALAVAWGEAGQRKTAKEAVTAAASKAKEVNTGEAEPDKLNAQAGAVSSALDSVSKLAGALKDLDRVGQLLTVAMGFFAVAAVAAGLNDVAEALADGASGT